MTALQFATLEDIVRQQPLGAPSHIDGHEAVVLSRVNGGQAVEVYCGGAIRQYRLDATASMVAATDLQVELLREALLFVDALRRSAVQEQQRQQASHHGVMEDIRDYVIQEHVEGTICHDGMSEFLRAFGLREHYCD